MVSGRGAEALEELRIRYLRIGRDRYLVLANGPVAAADVIEWRPRVSFVRELDELFKEAFREKPGAGATPIDDRLRELGRELFDALLPKPIRACVETSLRTANADDCVLRLKFHLPAELHGQPIEILCPPQGDPLGGPLTLNTHLSVVRAVARSRLSPRLPQPQDDPKPLTVLVVVASPQDRPALDVRRELDQLRGELSGPVGMDLVTVDFLGGPESEDLATLAALSNRVRRRRNPLAVLMIAHGETSPDRGQACVVLESEDRSAQLVPAEQVAAALGARGAVRFVALNFCVGARVTGRDPLSGVAQALISNGIPAVVGMSTGVTDEAGSRFSAPLLRALSRNETVDEAVRVARNQMSAVREDTRIEWCAPVLCVGDEIMRGRLFKVRGLHGGSDPLLAGQQAAQRVIHAPKVDFDDLAPAALFHRAAPDWERVQGLAKEGKDEANDHWHRELFKRLEREAGIELAVADIEELCRGMADGSPGQVRLRDVPQAVVALLESELARADTLRRYREQAAEAEAAQSWQAALDLWDAALRIDEHDEEAIRRAERVRVELDLADRHAEGQAAVDAGDWTAAEAVFAEILRRRPDGYRDAELALRYARGRQAGDDWPAVVDALQAFDERRPPDEHGHGYRDGGALLAYARGRIAETKEQWHEAHGCYEPAKAGLPASDAALRCDYARARAAEDDGDWLGAAAAYQSLPPGYADRDQRLCYAQGRVAEDDRDWSTAGEAFRACPAVLDAAARVGYLAGRAKEDRGDWTEAAAEYESVADRCADAARRATRLKRLGAAVGWVDGLARLGLVEDPVAARTHPSPYRLLRVAGIDPGSSAQEVKDASYALMRAELWTPEVRLAWDGLRSVPRRLEHDARLHRLHDADGLAQRQRELEPVSGDEPAPGEELVGRLREQLHRDAPLFSLLSGRRAEALAEWEARLACDLGAVDVAHALALGWTWHAVELGEAGRHEQAAESWERAVACWGYVLGAEEYWDAWRAERATRYQHSVSATDMAKARAGVAEWLYELLAERSDHCRREGRTEDAERYRRLRLALDVELAAARSLADAGERITAGGAALACGPLFLGRHPSLRDSIGHLVSALDPVVEQEPEPLARLRLRGLFSELAEAVVLVEQNQPDRALDALRGLHRVRLSELPDDCQHPAADAPDAPDDTDPAADAADAGERAGCPSCATFLERNPGYRELPHRRSRLLQDAVHLATHALLTLAQLALAEGRHGLDTVLKRWREAVEVAANTGTQVRTKRAIVPGVLARADALMEDKEPERLTGERLTEGLDLVTAARQLVGRADDGQLVAKETELLIARGIWYGSWCYPYEELNYERAVADLRRAVALSPDSLDPLENLCHGLVHWAASLPHESCAEQQLRLLAETLTILHDGLVKTSNHPVLVTALNEVLDEVEAWCFDELSAEELGRLLRELRSEPAEQSSVHTLRSLVDAVRSAPRHAGPRERLCAALTRAIDENYGH